MKIYSNNTNPNFTIILPGPCQANCSFCFWKRETDESSFILSLKRVLKKLPSKFTQISISGGEPTLSPVFNEALALINKYKNKGKFNKVVLTTNGIKLMDFDLTGIDHINISRHSVYDTTNREIFKTTKIIAAADLIIINRYINMCGIDVNYNVVITEQNNEEKVYDWLRFVKDTNATSVTFRNQYGQYGKSLMEQSLIDSNYKSHSVSSCPVCYTSTYIVSGVKMKFHSSDYEPTESKQFDENEVYELVLQPTGDLTRDWEANKIILKRKVK